MNPGLSLNGVKVLSNPQYGYQDYKFHISSSVFNASPTINLEFPHRSINTHLQNSPTEIVVKALPARWSGATRRCRTSTNSPGAAR